VTQSTFPSIISYQSAAFIAKVDEVLAFTKSANENYENFDDNPLESM